MNKILIMIYIYILIKKHYKTFLNTVMNLMMLLNIPIVSIIYIKSMMS